MRTRTDGFGFELVLEAVLAYDLTTAVAAKWFRRQQLTHAARKHRVLAANLIRNILAA